MAGMVKHCVLVPVDFSEVSLRAVREGIAIADKPQHLHIVHVLAIQPSAESDHTMSDTSHALRLSHTEDRMRSRFSEVPFEEVQFHVRKGDPGTEILELAKEIKADLIIVPARGKGGLARLVIGSVAERIVRHANCPVLVLRAPAPKITSGFIPIKDLQ